MKFVKAVKLDSVLGNLARPPDRVLIRTVQLHQTVQVVKIEKKKKKKIAENWNDPRLSRSTTHINLDLVFVRGAGHTMGGRRRTSSDSDALRADRNTEHQLHEPVTFIPDNHSSSRPREATELHEYYYYNDQDNDGSSSPSSISTDEQRRPQRQTTRSTTLSSSTIRTQRRRRTRWFSGLRRFWARNVALTVPQQRNRDYFGKSYY